MRTLKTSEAAAMLNVSANTLRRWEQDFGYPRPRRSPGRHRLYVYAEIAALRAALAEGLSISSAVSAASEVLDADRRTLVTALNQFCAAQADHAMEMSLALRSVERTVDDVLLPALAEIRRRKGTCSGAWAWSARWASDWLNRAQRVAPVHPDAPGMLIGDAAEGILDPASLQARALELCCTRGGTSVVTLPVCAVERLWEPIGAIDPAVVVIVGGHTCDDAVARWAYAVRKAAGELPFLLFHRKPQADLESQPRLLSESPFQAGQTIMHLLGATCERASVHEAARALAGGLVAAADNARRTR